MIGIGAPRKAAIATFLASLFGLGFYATPARADKSSYVIVSSGACSLIFDDVDVKAYRILTPAARLKMLADSRSPLRAHSCECLLLGRDSQSCLLEATKKAARPASLSKDEEALLDGRIFVVIDDSSQFSALYNALNSDLPQRRSALAWKLLHAASPATTVSVGGANSGPPTTPPVTPTWHGYNDSSGSGKKKRRCEIEPSVCMNVANGEPSMEFELKCEGWPPISVSTDGKAGLKIGPLNLSVSKNDDKKD